MKKTQEQQNTNDITKMKSKSRITKTEIYMEIAEIRAELKLMKQINNKVTHHFKFATGVIITLQVVNIIVHWMF